MGGLLLPLAAGFGLFVVIGTLVKSPGRGLQAKFRRAGILKGKSEAELVALVGLPQSRSALAGGYLLQWHATGYHIALRFDAAKVCQGVTHEFASR